MTGSSASADLDAAIQVAIAVIIWRILWQRQSVCGLRTGAMKE